MSNVTTDTMPLLDLILAGSEDAIDAKEAVRLRELCRGGKPIGLGVFYRWCRRGCRGVKLETAMIGGTLVTTRPAVARFLQAVNDQHEQTRAAGSPTPRQATAASRRAHEAAVASLARAGFTVGTRTGVAR